MCTVHMQPGPGGGSLLEIENFFLGEQIGWANLKLKRFCPRKDWNNFLMNMSGCVRD